MESFSVDQFEIGKALGRGRFGQVYLARHVPSNREVALKCLSKSLLQKANAVEQLRREVEIHSRLSHPNILPFLGYFQDASRVYVVLRLATGGTMYSKLKCVSRFSDDEAAALVASLLDGVSMLHTMGVFHRDLKPENVLLLEEGVPVLSDFGWSVHEPDNPSEHRRTTLCGTLEYAPPEVLANGRTHGSPVDVWSLGCLAYELLAGAGRSPFVVRDAAGALDEVATLRNIEGAKWTPPVVTPDDGGTPQQLFSSGAAAFIARCLVVDPSCRPSARELLSDPWIAPHVRPGAAELNAAAAATALESGVPFVLQAGADSPTDAAKAGLGKQRRSTGLSRLSSGSGAPAVQMSGAASLSRGLLASPPVRLRPARPSSGAAAVTPAVLAVAPEQQQQQQQVLSPPSSSSASQPLSDASAVAAKTPAAGASGLPFSPRRPTGLKGGPQRVRATGAAVAGGTSAGNAALAPSSSAAQAMGDTPRARPAQHAGATPAAPAGSNSAYNTPPAIGSGTSAASATSARRQATAAVVGTTDRRQRPAPASSAAGGGSKGLLSPPLRGALFSPPRRPAQQQQQTFAKRATSDTSTATSSTPAQALSVCAVDSGIGQAEQIASGASGNLRMEATSQSPVLPMNDAENVARHSELGSPCSAACTSIASSSTASTESISVGSTSVAGVKGTDASTAAAGPGRDHLDGRPRPRHAGSFRAAFFGAGGQKKS